MYLPDDFSNYWAIDIEGDDLPSNVVWCACVINIATGEELSFTNYDDIRKWVREQKQNGTKFVGHNIIGYDAPTLNRLVRCAITINDLVDTFLLSMVYSPSLGGGHSLEAWGVRLNYPKGKFNDFSRLTPEMLAYCKRDARLCRMIFQILVKRMKKVGFSENGLEIEHRSWQLIKKQQQNGFAFNIEGAHQLYAKLRNIENEFRDKIYEFWPPQLKVVATYKKPHKKDGSDTANFKRHKEEFQRVEITNNGENYDCYDLVYFNIGSPDQRIGKLLELGWKPREFTKTGNPQPTRKGQLVPSLVAFVEESGKEEVKLIANWLEINSRASMVNTWIEAYDDRSGCIHGTLWLANTLRYRHSNPNTANIPAVKVGHNGHPLMEEQGVFTYEARDLWTARSMDRVLVGVDAKGIQLRVLAHYLNNPDFTKAVLDGDPHSYNQEIGQFRSRAIAKTFIYAFLLGAGDAKIGEIVGGSSRVGREIKDRFIGNFPGLSDLLDDLERQVERTGRIVLCDRTPIIVSKPHTRLGYLLQGDESRIMKQAAIYTAKEIRKRNLDVLKVGDIHDEFQFDALRIHSEEFAYEVCPAAFRASGEYFHYRVPIDCDAKIGLTWAETH